MLSVLVWPKLITLSDLNGVWEWSQFFTSKDFKALKDMYSNLTVFEHDVRILIVNFLDGSFHSLATWASAPRRVLFGISPDPTTSDRTKWRSESLPVTSN